MAKGRLPDVAVGILCRMPGSLGDINTIADTVTLAQIYRYLIKLHDTMVKIRSNQGVSLVILNMPPPPPQLCAPFKISAPWWSRALPLPGTFQWRRMCTLGLVFLTTVRQQVASLPKSHLAQFYKVLHSGPTSQDPDTLYSLICFTGSRFFPLASTVTFTARDDERDHLKTYLITAREDVHDYLGR